MNMLHTRIAASFGLVIALCSTLGCTKAINPLPDKNTNWLKACDKDAECGSELACLCGACTKACGSSEQCGAVAPDAACVAARDPAIQAACGSDVPADAICSAACKRDRDCDAQADDLVCRNGLCVPREARVPDAPPRCEPGEVVADICGMECPGLNENAFATCDAGGHYGPCACQDPKCGPATDCAQGFTCFGTRCLQASNPCADCGAGETCLDGWCVEMLADGQSSPGDLAFSSDGDLYFVNTGTYEADGTFNYDASLMKLPGGRGPVARVADDRLEIGRMIIAGDDMYWFSRGRGAEFQVMQTRLPDGIPFALFLTNDAESTLVADNDALYWLERESADAPVKLRRVARDNATAPATTLLTLDEPASALTQSNGRLYWGAAETGLWSVNKNGTDLRRDFEATENLGGPYVLAGDDSGVTWSWKAEATFGLAYYVAATTMSTIIETSTIESPGEALVLDGDYVYRTQIDFRNEYGIVRTHRTDPDARKVLWRSPQLQAASRIFVRDGFIYISTTTGGTNGGKVFRARLPN